MLYRQGRPSSKTSSTKNNKWKSLHSRIVIVLSKLPEAINSKPLTQFQEECVSQYSLRNKYRIQSCSISLREKYPISLQEEMKKNTRQLTRLKSSTKYRKILSVNNNKYDFSGTQMT